MATTLSLRTTTSFDGGGSVVVEADVADLSTLAPGEHALVRDLLDVVATHAASRPVAAFQIEVPESVAVAPVVTPATAPELARHRRPKAKPAGRVRRDNGYSCPTCTATYAKAGNLARHISSAHAEPEPDATPAATADAVPPKADTTAAPARGRSTSAGVASLCLSGSHGACKAVVCSCHCHGGPGRSEAA